MWVKILKGIVNFMIMLTLDVKNAPQVAKNEDQKRTSKNEHQISFHFMEMESRDDGK